MIINSLLSHPCHLILGPHEDIHETVTTALQQELCPTKGCGICITCQNIKQKQHQNLLWLSPVKNYKKEDLKSIEEKTAYQLEDNHHFFIVITQADRLNTACSNSLLKLIEEPPTGYHFILCTQNKDALLPTIISRSLITTIAGTYADSTLSQLAQIFKQAKADFIEFLSLLDSQKPTEQEATALIEDLLYECIHQNETKNFINEEKIAILKQHLSMAPMPGSAKLFLKNVFLTLKSL